MMPVLSSMSPDSATASREDKPNSSIGRSSETWSTGSPVVSETHCRSHSRSSETVRSPAFSSFCRSSPESVAEPTGDTSSSPSPLLSPGPKLDPGNLSSEFKGSFVELFSSGIG